MLRSSINEIEAMLPEDALVLDVGGWAKPLARADWVIDLMPYETRGLYGDPIDPATERFSAETWVCRDICARELWPFGDKQFDFVVCAHTLEDIRDPIFACDELVRISKAGYVEVPSRLVEQAVGVHGPWVGWSHHRWLTESVPGGFEFVAKPHLLQSRPECQFPHEYAAALSEEQQVEKLFWRDGFKYRERIFFDAPEFDDYLADFVREHGGHLSAGKSRRRRWRRNRGR